MLERGLGRINEFTKRVFDSTPAQSVCQGLCVQTVAVHPVQCLLMHPENLNRAISPVYKNKSKIVSLMVHDEWFWGAAPY